MRTRARGRAGSAAVAAWLVMGALTSRTAAQERPQPPGELRLPAPVEAPRVDSPLSTTYSNDTWRDLPLNSLYELVETLEPSAIVDRFTGGGLSIGQPTRVGGFSGSWTQTQFRIDGVGITDATGTGTPLFFPELPWWSLVRANSGLMALDTNAPGVSFDLQPKMPTTRWVREVTGSTSHFFLTGKEVDNVPAALARLDGWDQASIVASGPLVPGRLGAVFGAAFTRASEYHRAEPLPVDDQALAAFSHLVLTPNDENQVRMVGLVQRVTYPFDQRVLFGQPQTSTADTSVHVQGVWERQRPSAPLWRVLGGYTRRQRTPDFDPTTGAQLERLVDGPLGQFAFLPPAATSSWSLGVSLDQSARAPASRVHALIAGANITGEHSETSPAFAGTVGELVHGAPARLWVFQSPGTESSRHEHTLAGWVGDRMTLSPTLQLEAGLRLERSSGSADGALDGVTWGSWLPRASARWGPVGAWSAVLFGGYTRTTDRLALDYLAVGDPAASTADVYRWQNATPVPLSSVVRGPLVFRVGPGTAGSPAFSTIDTNLRQPTSDEFAVGVDLQPVTRLHVRVRGFWRRVQNLLTLVDFGAPADTAYSVFTVQDPGSVASAQESQLVPVYNRLPASFGVDQFVLTNQGTDNATYKALEISLRFETERFLLFGGGVAGIAEGPAAARGFGPLENDQATIGELGGNPNAGTYAQGRFFTDRAFTGKLATVFKLPSEMRLGLIARYQDGQPFARMLILSLNQGVEAVRAFANGDSRFTFVGTLDVRFQKRFSFGERSLTLLADAYNLLNLSNSVEEDVAAGPNIRLSTATQPPRSFHVGLRVGF